MTNFLDRAPCAYFGHQPVDRLDREIAANTPHQHAVTARAQAVLQSTSYAR